jgi:hypothetical protein
VDVDALQLAACGASAREAMSEAIVKRFFIDVEESDMEDTGIAVFLDPRFKLLDLIFPDHELFNVKMFRLEIMSAIRLVWKMDWKQMDNEEVMEVEEPPLKKQASRSMIMKSVASLHVILSGRKPIDIDMFLG